MQEIQEIFTRADRNLDALMRISGILNRNPDAVCAEDVRMLTETCGVSRQEAVLALLCAVCGLDEERYPDHRELKEQYFRPGLAELDAETYRQNAYFKNIRLPEAMHGRWQLTNLRYQPFEVFVRDDLLCMPDGREIPQLGYFPEEFVYPAVLENGREWMTVTPNEIATMRAAVAKAHGSVVTMGLGLGYFAYCVSEKPEVDSITVIERDSDVIELFKTCILPQFSHPEKVRILQTDALVFAERQMGGMQFDFLFADLWHDVSDGADMYLRIKRQEHRAPQAEFAYWVETSILAWLRGMLLEEYADGWNGCFSEILPKPRNAAALRAVIHDDFLRRIAPQIPLKIAGMPEPEHSDGRHAIF